MFARACGCSRRPNLPHYARSEPIRSQRVKIEKPIWISQFRFRSDRTAPLIPKLNIKTVTTLPFLLGTGHEKVAHTYLRFYKTFYKVASSPASTSNLPVKKVLKAPLSHSIEKEYINLVSQVSKFNLQERTREQISFTGKRVSVADLIAYQIGWGKLLLTWYKKGVNGEAPDMPGEGFKSWDYTGLAQLFYQKYRYDSGDEQMKEFASVIKQILEMTEREHETGNLDRPGVWAWCTLKSGKQWPLSKWITVNTSSPYKRAVNLIRSL